MIDGLVMRGLVIRHQVDGDRRRVGLDLTEDGRRLLAEADEGVERRLHDIADYGPESGVESLEDWKSALDAYRSARRAGAPRAGTTEVAAT